MKKIIIVLSFSILAKLCFAWPIKPAPLRELIQKSQFVVVGFVDKIIDNDIDTTIVTDNSRVRRVTFMDKDAIISIREVLIGNFTDKEICIKFNPNTICPAQPNFIANTTVLLFLNYDENSELEVCSLSYGAKTLDESGLSIYKQRISEMLKISSISDTTQRLKETTAWLVKLAENKYTRWEGCYEFSPSSVSYIEIDRELPDYKPFITSKHKQTLFDVLIKIDTISGDDLGLIDFVIGFNDRDLLIFLKEKIIKYDLTNAEIGDIRLIEELLSRIVKLADCEEINNKFNKP